MELDFTSTDITNVDISAIAAFGSGGHTHTIYKGDGTTPLTTVIHSYQTGAPPVIAANVLNGTGIEVSETTLGGASDNQILAFPVTGSVDWDEDFVMVEFLISGLLISKNLDQFFVAISNTFSYDGRPSYGGELQRIDPTHTEIKCTRRDTSSGTVKSAFKSEAPVTDYYFQIIFNCDGAIVYENSGGTTYQDPRAPTNFVGQTGTYTISANYPTVARWTAPHILVFSLCDGSAVQPLEYTIKKLRVSKWTPAA